MTRIARLNGVWYIIDFGQKTYWSTGSDGQANFYIDTIRMPRLPDGDTSILSGFRRIGV